MNNQIPVDLGDDILGDAHVEGIQAAAGNNPGGSHHPGSVSCLEVAGGQHQLDGSCASYPSSP